MSYLLKRKKNQVKWGMTIEKCLQKDFAKRVKELKADVVRAYGGYWACDLAVAEKVEGVPVICSVHDTNVELIHNSTLKADYVWPVSMVVADALVTKGVNPKNIFMFTNRVDVNVFRPLRDWVNLTNYERKKKEFDNKYPGKYRILHVGRKTEQKNAVTLFKALQILGDDYSAIFIGQGNMKLYKSWAQQYKVNHRAFLLNRVANEEIAWYLVNSDVHCTPSLWEGFGVVFIEALATETMVVTSNIAPMNEYITDGYSGLLLKNNKDPEELAATLRRAVTDKELQAKIKPNARKAAMKFDKFSIDKWEVELYRYVLNHKSGPDL